MSNEWIQNLYFIVYNSISRRFIKIDTFVTYFRSAGNDITPE